MRTRFPILIIDDDPDLLVILKAAATKNFPEAAFQQVYTLAEAKAYFQQLEGVGPKLVLLDIGLKNNENGLDFLAFLQAHKQARFLTVIVLTVSELETDIKNAYLLGAASYSIKPDTLPNWVNLLTTLRTYWLNTVTLPTLWFGKRQWE